MTLRFNRRLTRCLATVSYFVFLILSATSTSLAGAACNSAFIVSPSSAIYCKTKALSVLDRRPKAAVVHSCVSEPDVSDATGNTSSSNQPRTCARIGSADAATLTRHHYCNNESGGSKESLLVITTDASGGSGRFHGLCALLRQVGGAPRTTTATTNINQNSDLLSIVTRRTRSVPQCTGRRKSRKRRTARRQRIGSNNVVGIPAEIAAASLGIRTALQNIPRDRRRSVLLLVDCERALTYLCDHLYDRTDALGRALGSLAEETIEHTINVARVASVSRREDDGMLDHAAADYIAGLVRSVPNAKYIYGDVAEDDGGRGKIPATGRACPALEEEDLNWLESSDDVNGNNEPKITTLAQDRENGVIRLSRLKQRIEKMEYDLETLSFRVR